MSGLADLFNSQLNPPDEKRFLQWAASQGRMGDLEDYDLRGAFKANIGASGNGHYPDTYKKPNHPTFSEESMYSTPQAPGGSWQQAGDQWVFWASPQNMQSRPMGSLADYFRQIEPGNSVVFPVDYQLPRRK